MPPEQQTEQSQELEIQLEQGDQQDTTTQTEEGSSEGGEGTSQNEPSETELYQQALAEQAALLRQSANDVATMKAQLQELRDKANAPPPEVEEELPDFMSPKEQMQWLAAQIRKEVAKSTEGINRVAQDYGRQSQVAQAKQIIAAHPEFGPMTAEMGDEANRIIESYHDFNNPQGLALMLQARYGQMARAGELKKPGSESTTSTPSTTKPNNTPTNRNPILSTKPPVNSGNKKPPALVITEAERALAARRGMSPEQWCEIRDLGSDATIDQLNAIDAKYKALKGGKK